MDLVVGGPKSLAARNLRVQPTSTPKAPLADRRQADRSCRLCGRLRGAACHREAPGAARGATDAREVRVLWPAVQNEQRPGLAHPRGAPKSAAPPAKGTPVAAPAPVVGGADQADGPPPRADGGREPGATTVEPPARPWWRRLFGRRPPELRRGRVAEGPSARSVPPGGVRTPAARRCGPGGDGTAPQFAHRRGRSRWPPAGR
jgi:hypothetical protein